MSQELDSASNSQYKISFNYYGDKIRVYKKLINVLGTPKYIQFLINTDELLLYVRGTNQHDTNCLEVPKFAKSKHFSYELHGRYFIKKISSLAGWKLNSLYVITGVLIPEHNIIAFDLKEAERVITEK